VDALDQFDVGPVVVIEEEDASVGLECVVDELLEQVEPVFGYV
jgi:hypothetical protein